MEKRRVLITGVGIICAIGNNYEQFFAALEEGMSGVGRITAFDPTGLSGENGCEVKHFDPAKHFPAEESRRMDRSCHLSLVAVREAIESSGLDLSRLDKKRCGVSAGSTIGGMISGFEYYRRLKKGKISPGLLLDQPLYSVGSRICAKYGFFGPNITISTACSSANIALGYAYDLIRSGEMDIMAAGGFDPMAEITCSGFGVLRNISPDISRPFDKNRKGLVLGEGAAYLLLEAEDHVRQRGGKAYGEFLGYGLSSDAYHMTAPDILGKGAARSMQQAIENSRIDREDIDYINAHGTGTKLNDQMESTAIKKVFGKRAYDIPVSSIKAMVGHTLGASGAVEAIAMIAAMHGGFIPPTINYETPDPRCDLDYTPNRSRKRTIRIALSNNFGFGGNNCSIIIRKV